MALLARQLLVGVAAWLFGAPPPVAVNVHNLRNAHNLHNTHLSHTRLVIEGPVVLARIRMYRDDLERALKRKVTPDVAAQAVVAQYVTKNFSVRADDVPLTGELLDGGADTDGDQAVWWVLVQWKAAKPVKAVGLKVHVLFDTFDDQQNLVVVNRQPGDERRSLYFQAGDRTEQVVRF